MPFLDEEAEVFVAGLAEVCLPDRHLQRTAATAAASAAAAAATTLRWLTGMAGWPSVSLPPAAPRRVPPGHAPQGAARRSCSATASEACADKVVTCGAYMCAAALGAAGAGLPECQFSQLIPSCYCIANLRQHAVDGDRTGDMDYLAHPC